MARPRKSLLSVTLTERNGRFFLRWGRESAIWISLGQSLGRAITREEAERRRAEIQGAIASGNWPAWALRHPKVKAFAAGRKIETRAQAAAGGLDVLERYRQHLAQQGGSSDWRTGKLAFLRELAAFASARGEEDLASVTPETAQAWIDSIPGSPCPYLKRRPPRSQATANRALAACSGFYRRWAIPFAGFARNPFADVRQMAEADPQEIDYLTVEERNRVLAAAEAEGPEGLAVWIALLTGMRRSEIGRLAWPQVNLLTRKATVTLGKTPNRRKCNRVVDLATPLQHKLDAIPAGRRRGRVVPWPEEESQMRTQADNLIDRVRARIAAAAMPKKPAKDGKPTAAQREAQALAARVGWTNFRHTFCTLHAQAGVSPYTIIGWTGHSLDVFMRHYGGHVREWDSKIDLVEEQSRPGVRRKQA